MPRGVYARKPEHTAYLRERMLRLRNKRKYHPRTEEEKRAISEGTRKAIEGKKPWNLDLKKETDPRVAKQAKNRKGIPVPLERRKRISASVKANPTRYWLGMSRDEETKKKISNARSNQKALPKENTIPEKLIIDQLINLGFKYIPQQKLYLLIPDFNYNKRIKADFYLNEINVLVFVDGDFIHANPLIYKEDSVIWPSGNVTAKSIWDRDAKVNKILTENKVRFIRMWESDILKDPLGILKSSLSKIGVQILQTTAYCDTCNNSVVLTDIFPVDQKLGIYKGYDKNLHLIEFSID